MLVEALAVGSLVERRFVDELEDDFVCEVEGVIEGMVGGAVEDIVTDEVIIMVLDEIAGMLVDSSVAQKNRYSYSPNILYFCIYIITE